MTLPTTIHPVLPDQKPKHDPSSKTARILSKLKTEGTVTNRELNKICFRYSARLAELRAEGHDILTVQVQGGLFEYVYRGEVQS
jgi:hypothetical protein